MFFLFHFDGFEEKVDSATYFYEFWSSLCPIWIQSSLFESFEPKLNYSDPMGQIYQKIWSVWNKVLKKEKEKKQASKQFFSLFKEGII